MDNFNKKYSFIQSFYFSLILSSLFVVILCVIFDPRWELNDDIAMSMIAYGYGIAETASPNLVFSNVLWGYAVKLIPNIIGITGYSLFMYIVICLSGAIIFYTLTNTGISVFISLFILIITIFRPVLFPQFTITSGLSMVGAMLLINLYQKNNNWKLLILASFTAWLSFLIRAQEALLIFVLALPLFNWRKTFNDKKLAIAFICTISIIALSFFIDRIHYQNEQWDYFNEINLARIPYTDYGAGKRLLVRPDIYTKYGYTENDIRLIDEWGIYADPKLVTPQTLTEMFKELGVMQEKELLLKNIVISWKAIFSTRFLLIVLLALILFISRFNLSTGIIWLLFLMSISVMGLLGRPGKARVYYPITVLLLISPLLNSPKNVLLNEKITTTISSLITIAVIYTTSIFSLNVASGDKILRAKMLDFPRNTVFIWGFHFPYEAIFPVISMPTNKYKFNMFGVFAPAPFSIAYNEYKKGRGMVNQFKSDNGMQIIADKNKINILGKYCAERLSGKMQLLSETKYAYGYVTLTNIKCDISNNSKEKP